MLDGLLRTDLHILYPSRIDAFRFNENMQWGNSAGVQQMWDTSYTLVRPLRVNGEPQSSIAQGRRHA